MRFFDARGKLTEICYQAGNPELGVPLTPPDLRWLSFLQAASGADKSLTFTLLNGVLNPDQRDIYRQTWEVLKGQKQAIDQLGSDPTRKADADKMQASLAETIAKALTAKTPGKKGGGQTLRDAAITAIGQMAALPGTFLDHQDAIFTPARKSGVASASADLRAELKRLSDLGVLIEDSDSRFHLAGGSRAPSPGDRYYLRQLNLTVLSQILLPGFLHRSPAPLYVDPRLGTPKAWRDVYRYDEQGQRSGWVRHYQGRTWRFNGEGQCLTADDRASPVTYRLEAGHLVFDPPPK